MIKRQQIGLAFMGFMIIGFGAGALPRSRLHYPNVWSGAVFAPFAIFVGLLFFVTAALWRKKERY